MAKAGSTDYNGAQSPYGPARPNHSETQAHSGHILKTTSAAAAAHLQQAVSLGIEGVLELQHVLVLLRVDVLIGKVDRQALQLEPHDRRCCSACSSAAQPGIWEIIPIVCYPRRWSACAWDKRRTMSATTAGRARPRAGAETRMQARSMHASPTSLPAQDNAHADVSYHGGFGGHSLSDTALQVILHRAQQAPVPATRSTSTIVY